MRDRLDFLYSAVSDSQSTIRSIDIRSGFLFIALFSPISVADKILDAASRFSEAPHFLQLMCIGAIAAWTLAIYTLLMSVVAISNPVTHIRGDSSSGIYFGGDLFSFGLIDAFTNRKSLSHRDIDSEVAALPSSQQQIERELTFEKMKLSYIRSIKIQRFRVSLYLTIIWIFFSSATSLIAIFNK